MQHSPTSSLIPPAEVQRKRLDRAVPFIIGLAMACSVFLFFRNAGRSLNYNESHNLIYAASHEAIELLKIDDMHPPGFYLFMHFWQKVAHQNEMLLRLPSLLFSLLSLLLVYKVGRKLCGRPAAVAGVVLLAVTPLYVDSAASARPYALMMLAFLVSLLSFLLILEQNKSVHHVTNSLSILAALFLHYYTIFIPIYQIIFLLLNHRNRPVIKKWLPFQAAVAAIYSPLAYIAATYQLQLVNSIGGAGILTLANLIKLFYAMSPLAQQYAYTASPGVVIIALLFLSAILLGSYPPNKNLLSIVIIAAPIVIVAAVSNLSELKFYQAYHFTFLLPVFVLVAAHGLTRFGRTGYLMGIPILCLALVMPVQQPNPDWRLCAEYLRFNTGGNDKVIVCPDLNDGLFYYWPSAPIIPVGFVKPGMSEPRRIWLVFVYKSIYYNEAAEDNLLNWFRYLGFKDEPVDAGIEHTNLILLHR